MQDNRSLIDTSHISLAVLSTVGSQEFRLYPKFFTTSEQNQLLSYALKQLDDVHGISRDIRKRRRALKADGPPSGSNSEPLRSFLPAECYDFDSGHFDGVIHNYRESLVSSWPEEYSSTLSKALSLMPVEHSLGNVLTHALHLAPNGEILPHVDHVEASGQTILGISIGAPRILRLQSATDESAGWIDILLESGSIYVQTDHVRYQFKHSVPRDTVFRNRPLESGHRMSIMIRDKYVGQQHP